MFGWFTGRFPAVTGHDEVERVLDIDNAGWLIGKRVRRWPSERHQRLATPAGMPVGVMWHFTAVKPGTALWKRIEKRPRKDQRSASWHVIVEVDGALHQSVSFERGSWHCRPATLVQHRGERYTPNASLIGVELAAGPEAADPKYIWPAPQVESATRLVRVLAETYGLDAEQLAHMHQDFDPTRRNDAGRAWAVLLPRILDLALD